MRKTILSIILCYLLYPYMLFAVEKPSIECSGLPGCEGGTDTTTVNIAEKAISTLIAQGIQYIAVLAVLSLMISGILYLISGGEDEKTNKAKKAIIWSLVGVFISISAWTIINLLNKFEIL